MMCYLKHMIFISITICHFDILAAVKFINFLDHNQVSIVQKYWVHLFRRKTCNNFVLNTNQDRVQLFFNNK
jgi:hypothetical protein